MARKFIGSTDVEQGSQGDILVDSGVMSAPYKISVTSTSAALPALIGATIPANLLAVGIFRAESSSEVIRHAFGTASAASAAWPEGAASAAMTKAKADTLELYAANTTEATVWLITPRG
ncbi:MAG: hypothetical protein WC992_04800 [Acholeplasmataceae bacterium]|jgi:hypothetical protein